jgi:hypothetical protein
MKAYINKSALVAEIEKRIKETESMQPKFDQFWAGQISAFKGILKILDTLEVKEVNLEKEATEFVQTKEFVVSKESPVLLIAKHFFELGLKVKGE